MSLADLRRSTASLKASNDALAKSLVRRPSVPPPPMRKTNPWMRTIEALPLTEVKRENDRSR